MANTTTHVDKFAGSAGTSATVEAFHSAIRERVAARLAEAGGDWRSFVFDRSQQLLTSSDFRTVEKLLLDAGHLFEWSAAISQQERPDIYQHAEGVDEQGLKSFSFEHQGAQLAPADAQGWEQRGQGDNVARYPQNRTGTARYIRSPAQVLQYIQNGVPPDTIALIDDSGGTLTAPILSQLAGVICAGGTTRSHLGILTREYGVPCLMNAHVAGIHHGDTVCMEVTAQPRVAADYQNNRELTGRIWRKVD